MATPADLMAKKSCLSALEASEENVIVVADGHPDRLGLDFGMPLQGIPIFFWKLSALMRGLAAPARACGRIGANDATRTFNGQDLLPTRR